jgi:benzoyl-CoA reductase/2-hydroxyglutaryl-CoA dehydratase subunit BcrC/BadD/HgdB
MTGAVVYASPFVPPEWIAAHGLRPTRPALGPPRRPEGSAGRCPFAEAFVDRASGLLGQGEARAIVATSTCDQMRRGTEALPHRFLFEVPHTWQTASAHRTYVSELRRLGRFLVEWGGREPDDDALLGAMRRFDDGRRALLSARDGLGGRGFAEAVAAFHERGDGRFETADRPRPGAGGVPVALVGGPLRADQLALHDVIEAAGGRVALDATETGERTFPARFDRRRMAGDPVLELADAYFGTIPAVFRRPNRMLYEYLRRELDARDVRAIVVVHCVWCDLWRAEAGRIGEWSGRPVTTVDLADGDAGWRRIETRIQALLESAGGRS